MTPKEVLNRLAYPRPGDNARRKTYPLHDTAAISAGTREYNFFESAITNTFNQNKRFPMASTEIFAITGISAFLQQEINTTAEIDNLNELLQQGYLEVWNNSRLICKIPCLDFVNYIVGHSLEATDPATIPMVGGNLNRDGFLGRKFASCPIIFVGNSNFKFKLKITTQSATDFDAVPLRLSLYGIQTDKLGSFPYDELKNNKFQEIPVTFYETRAISTANETTYTLFESGVAENLQSMYFPLSDIEVFSLEAIEFFVNQPGTPVSPETIYNSSIQKILKIRVDEVDYWDSAMGTQLLSMLAGFDVTLTTTPDTKVTELLHVRKQLVLPMPLVFPANGKVKIQVIQPASSVPASGEFTLALRGTATRRVA